MLSTENKYRIGYYLDVSVEKDRPIDLIVRRAHATYVSRRSSACCAGFGAFLAVLAFAFTQQSVRDMPVAFTWLMIFLTFPVGLLGAPFVGVIWSSLSKAIGLGYHPFIDLLQMWLALVAVGYAQWFVVLPAVVRRLRRAKPSA